MSEELIKRLRIRANNIDLEFPKFAALLREAANALSRPATVQVPEGWKLVPIEPTAEQIFAMDSFSEMCFEQFGRDADTDEFYRAGIAAAPQPKKESDHD